MQAHRLIEVLERASVDKPVTFGGQWERGSGVKRGQVGLADIAHIVRIAEKFEVPCPVFNETEAAEVISTVNLMAEHGLCKLPYETCYLEMVIDPSTMRARSEVKPEGVHGTTYQRIGVVLQELTFGPGPNAIEMLDLRHAETQLAEPFRQTEGFSLRPMIEALYPMRLLMFTCPARPGDKGFKGWGEPIMMQPIPNRIVQVGDWSLHREQHDLWRFAAFYMVAWFLFLLHARGTSRAVYAKPEKLNKARLKRREEPIDGFTKVLMPGFMARKAAGEMTEDEVRQHGNQGREVTERKRPRLHWRRGHVRGVRYGEGRKLSKATFIAATLVGYEEEGRIYHLQYGQELSTANLAELEKAS